MDEKEKEVSEIKTLINEGKSVEEILKIFPNTTKGRINAVKYGNSYPNVLPLTPNQLNRKKNPKPKRQVIPINRFPMTVTIESEFVYQVWREALEREEQRLMVELAKITLQRHAIETDDYSNISESLLKEMEERRARLAKELEEDESKTA